MRNLWQKLTKEMMGIVEVIEVKLNNRKTKKLERIAKDIKKREKKKL